MLIAEKLGVDDFSFHFWISALNTAISFWLASKFKNETPCNPWFLSLLMFALGHFLFSSQWSNWSSGNQLIGFDKIIFGQTVGLLAVFIGNLMVF